MRAEKQKPLQRMNYKGLGTLVHPERVELPTF